MNVVLSFYFAPSLSVLRGNEGQMLGRLHQKQYTQTNFRSINKNISGALHTSVVIIYFVDPSLCPFCMYWTDILHETSVRRFRCFINSHAVFGCLRSSIFHKVVT